VEYHRIASIAARTDDLRVSRPRVAADDRLADGNIDRRCPIVLDQLHFAYWMKCSAEHLEHGLWVRSTPLIEGLVDIAEEGEIAVWRGELRDDRVFLRVGVLHFIHLNPVKLRLPAFQGVRILTEEARHQFDQIAEVDGVAAGEFSGIVREQLRMIDGVREAALLPKLAVDLIEDPLKIEALPVERQLALHRVHKAQKQIDKELFLLLRHISDLAADTHAQELSGVLLVVDNEVSRDTEGVRLLADDARTEAVECTHGDLAGLGWQGATHPLADLVRRFVGE